MPAEAAYGLTVHPTSPAYLGMPTDEHGKIPQWLSETGAFKDVKSLTPVDALIPYDLNVPFWSDGAAKQRWVSVPNDPARQAAKIKFAPTCEWTFPAGTVFVKHFEIATDEAHPEIRRRLETRLLVRDAAGGVYGVSYRWRADNTDAERVSEGHVETIAIKSAAGTRKQNWYFPGSADCRTCHTQAAGYVLGVKTRQLNRAFTYPSTGTSDNELRAWNHIGLFDSPLSDADIGGYAKLAPADDVRASIEDRARSFLDANCAQCHRPGGVAGLFDARYDTPLAKQNLVDGPVLINLGLDHARLIAPNDVWRSVILARLQTLEQPKMPPLAHETIDESGVALIAKWIESLPGRVVLAPPAMSPLGGEFKNPVTVRLTHPDAGAVLHYTLDGSVPGAAAPVYEKPLQITGPTTIRASAFKKGATKSITVQETYIVGE